MIMQRSAPCGTREGRGLERTRFFGQQLIGPEDLTQDQIYFREKLRRHNRMLHGWGVVCGACVTRGQSECELVIEPGYILGPQGDEIAITQALTIDLCSAGLDEAVGCCGESSDPWCREGRRTCKAGTVYLAVRYDECLSRPVRTLAGACESGCGGPECEHSRIQDSFAWALLSELPEGYTTPMRQPSFQSLIPCVRGQQRPCRPCPESPWVVLADVEVGSDCSVLRVDCFRHRRYVVSFADYFLTCLFAGKYPSDTGYLGRVEDIQFNARAVAYAAGTMDLIDMGMVASGLKPKATVTFLRSDGSAVSMPAFFSVQPGETVEHFLEREGDRRFYDPASEEAYSLREIYAAAGVAADTVLDRTSDAIAFFEGRTVDLPALREDRAVLEDVLTRDAMGRLDRDASGSADMAADLEATALKGLGDRSDVGKAVKDKTIGDIARTTRDAFLADVLAGVPADRKAAAERKAAEVWETARRVLSLRRPG